MHPFVSAAKDDDLEIEKKKEIIRTSIEKAMVYALFAEMCQRRDMDTAEAVEAIVTGLLNGAELDKEVQNNVLYPDQAQRFKKLVADEMKLIQLDYLLVAMENFFKGN